VKQAIRLHKMAKHPFRGVSMFKKKRWKGLVGHLYERGRCDIFFSFIFRTAFFIYFLFDFISCHFIFILFSF
jgi:hypothetical protein